MSVLQSAEAEPPVCSSFLGTLENPQQAGTVDQSTKLCYDLELPPLLFSPLADFQANKQKGLGRLFPRQKNPQPGFMESTS